MTPAERAQLQRDYNNNQQSHANKVAEQNNIRNQIQRLQTIERQMRGHKQTIDRLRQSVRQRSDTGAIWSGNLRDAHSDHISDTFRQRYNTYYSQTDNLHDAIILRIAQLQNQDRNLVPVINELVNLGNSLWARLRTVFN